MRTYILLCVLVLQACIPQAVLGEATEEEKAAAEAEKLAAEEDAKESIAVDLTEDNFFDVVLNPKVNVLVMFYSRPTIWSKQYMPAYQNLAKIFKEESNCIVAKVNVNHYRQLMTIYEYGGMMKFWFFAADVKTDGVLYEGSRGVGSLMDFLNEKCGTNRKIDGTIDMKKGRNEAFDNIASTFVDNWNTTTDEDESANDTDAATGAYYVHVMKKVTEKGVGYLTEEMERLSKILGGYLKTEKRRETNARMNILKHFDRLLKGESEEEKKEAEDLTETEEGTKDEGPKAPQDIVMDAIMGNTKTGSIRKDDFEKSEL